MTYTQAAVERAMKVHEVLMQALNGRQPWIQVAEVLGVSARTVRRLRWRYERDGFTGLYDHRHHTPSPRAVPLAEVQRILQAPRAAPATPRAPAVFRRIAASRRQPPSLAGPGAGRLSHRARHRR